MNPGTILAGGHAMIPARIVVGFEALRQVLCLSDVEGPSGILENVYEEHKQKWLHPDASGEPVTRRLIPTRRDATIE